MRPLSAEVVNAAYAVFGSLAMSLSKVLEPDYLHRTLSLLGFLIAVSIASLAGYAVYCFLTKFGE